MTITFNPASPFAFPTTYTGSSTTQTVTVSNSDTANAFTISLPTASGFTSSASSLTLPAATTAGAGTSTVTISFAPAETTATYAGSVVCTPATGTAVTFAFTGTAVAGLSVRPSIANFGTIAVGAQVTQTVLVTNISGADVALTAPAPFTISPASIPQNSFDLTVTITFTPGAKQSYTGAVTGAGGALACSLSGSGSGDPDKYESEYDSTETATLPGGVENAAGTKYYQVGVPNFGLDAPVGSGSGNSGPGNSFFRMGSFPSLTDASNFPPGFPASLALAKLVGDSAAILAVEGEDLDPSLAANAIKPSYKGDPNYMLGFSDDTRFRKGDTDALWQARRNLTRQLLTKGGWWDHADGNRISTTAGDKIDIIQGNYKMMVLGHQTVPASPTAAQLAAIAAGTLITDISGGLMAENGPSPTHCIKSIEYVFDDGSDTWEVYQNNGIGKVFSSFYGDTVDIFLGQHKATWTGHAPSDYSVEDNDADILNAYNVYQKSLAIRTQLGESAITDNPAIIDHVWASKILGYKGSSSSKIPLISDVVHAKTITGEVNASTITNTTNVGVATVYSKITDSPSGDIISMTKAASITNLTAAGHIMDMSIALRTAIAVGLSRDIYLGGKWSLAIGMFDEIRLGPKFEIISGAATTVNLEEGEELNLFGKIMVAPTILLGI